MEEGQCLSAPAPEVQMQGVRGGRASARTSAGGAHARSAGGRASARTSARGAHARSAGARASASTSARGAHARTAGPPRTHCMCPFALVRADARPPALLACAPLALVLAEARDLPAKASCLFQIALIWLLVLLHRLSSKQARVITVGICVLWAPFVVHQVDYNGLPVDEQIVAVLSFSLTGLFVCYYQLYIPSHGLLFWIALRALALELEEPVGFSHGTPQKRRKTVMTVYASLVPGNTGGAAASGTHSAIAASGTHCATAAVGVPESEFIPLERRVYPSLPRTWEKNLNVSNTSPRKDLCTVLYKLN